MDGGMVTAFNHLIYLYRTVQSTNPHADAELGALIGLCILEASIGRTVRRQRKINGSVARSTSAKTSRGWLPEADKSSSPQAGGRAIVQAAFLRARWMACLSAARGSISSFQRSFNGTIPRYWRFSPTILSRQYSFPYCESIELRTEDVSVHDREPSRRSGEFPARAYASA